jgi:phosphopantothenoylcysteine decarboxylase/phosphopantothenate--cysteine ligase
LGHEVILVSGPVDIRYPEEADVVPVVSTEEMLRVAQREFATCDGAIGVAAPCDYRPVKVADQKLSKTGEPLVLHLVETEDVIANLGAAKQHRWIVGFALETEDHRFRAITKAQQKNCDLMVLNSPTAMQATETAVELLDKSGEVLANYEGTKLDVSRRIMEVIQQQLLTSGS